MQEYKYSNIKIGQKLTIYIYIYIYYIYTYM